MKLLGSILLTAGFLAGAYVSVAQVDAVDWLHYGVCAGLMLAGMLALRARAPRPSSRRAISTTRTSRSCAAASAR